MKAAKHDHARTAKTRIPKLESRHGSNLVKDPDQWTSGHDRMTGAQASYLHTLSEEAHRPAAFDDSLEKAEASKRIDQLKSELRR